jgi:hypothetical protein
MDFLVYIRSDENLFTFLDFFLVLGLAVGLGVCFQTLLVLLARLDALVVSVSGPGQGSGQGQNQTGTDKNGSKHSLLLFGLSGHLTNCGPFLSIRRIDVYDMFLFHLF